MRMIVIVYDGYIAEGHVVLSTWSSVIDVCYTDAETIYLRNIHIHHRQHHLAGIALHHSALECPSHLGSRIWRPRPANSTQLNSTAIIINIIYNINPAYCTGWQVCLPSQTNDVVSSDADEWVVVLPFMLQSDDILVLRIWFVCFKVLKSV